MKLVLSAFACSFALMAETPPDDVKKDPRTFARAKYAKHSAEALKIVEPVQISRVFYYKDGGTAGIELIDAKDKKHTFSLYPPGGAGLPEKDKKRETIPNLFVGATHPTHPKAKVVAVRGPEESALYGVLLRAIEKHKEKDAILAENIDRKLWEARKLWGTDLFELHRFFHRLESHFLQE